jgi:glycosyltransferase involved in cell wall biosynthesis
MAQRPTFLMVGTLEPRKGYLQTIDAFTQLWDQGVDVNLVIVGKEGWTSLAGPQRRTIPHIIRAIGVSTELGERFFWLEEVSDEALELLYSASNCIIVASEAEGFGLPIIEAAHHELPLIVRDIPVFREVAGAGAFYFKGKEPQDLCAAIEQWLSLNEQHLVPSSQSIEPLSWAQSAQLLWSSMNRGIPRIT